MDDYPKNRKPMVKTVAAKTGFKQGSQNLSSVTKPVASKTAFGENIMINNGVTSASSAKLQAAGRLPGRLGQGGAHKKLS